MLGELIGEEQGKRTYRKVLSVDGELKVEVSLETDGKLLGIDIHATITYLATARPDGTLYAEGRGAIMSAKGEGAAWVGAGTGKFGPGGSVSYRGAVYYQSPSPSFAKLNGTCGVFEFEADAAGNSKSKIWEWK
jgi:hypothetical protein